MDKKLCIYFPKKTRGFSSLAELFAEYRVSKLAGDPRLVFEKASLGEENFLRLCEEYDIAFQRTVIRKITGKEIFNSPFYYLHVREQKDYLDSVSDMWKYSGLARGPFSCSCGINEVQVNKIRLDETKLTQLDISKWPYSSAILVSRKLKEALDERGFTGFTLVPCLDAALEFSDEELLLSNKCDSLSESANYFQIIINARPAGLPKVGKIEKSSSRNESQCSVCGSIDAFNIDEELENWPYFEPGDLLDVDIQQAEKVSSDTFGEFYHYTLPIISVGFLDFLLKNKFKGLKTFYAEMGVKHEAVYIREKGD